MSDRSSACTATRGLRIGMGVPALGFSGGIEKHAWDLARSLRARGHRIVLLHGPREGRDAETYARAFDDVRPLEAVGAARDLDVVYQHRAGDVRELAPFGSLPVVVATHDHDLTCVRSHRYLPLGLEPCHRPPGVACVTHGCAIVRNRAADTLLPFATRSPFALRARLHELARRAPLVACSRYVADNVVRAGVARDRVHVVHPIPPEDDTPVLPRPPGGRLLAVGQLLRGKGFDLAIAALAHLPGDVSLDIVGEGSAREELERLAGSLSAGRARVVGYVSPDALAAHYDRAAVVLVPSRWPEPFGMVGVEGMRRGRPIVGARHGGIPEWLEEGRAGRLFEPGSPSSLARAVLAVLGDEEAGARALAFVRERFHHAATVDAVERILVVAARGPA